MKQILALITICFLMAQNLFGMINFAPFPGINATDIAVDTQGRAIVAGSRDNTSQSSIVRYSPNGQSIETFYDPFPGGIVNAIAIDARDRIIAVGTQGAVIRYDTNGKVDNIFSKFPGQKATAIILLDDGSFLVVGAAGQVALYINELQAQPAQGLIFNQKPITPIPSTQFPFQAFPGQLATCCALKTAPQNPIVVGGQGGVIGAYSSKTRLFLPYQTFPGQAIKAMIPISNRGATDSPALLVVGDQSLVVEYSNEGKILKTFQPFPGVSGQYIILDFAGLPIVCGLESQVVKYNLVGNITQQFSAFPAPNPQSMAINQQNQLLVVGKQSAVSLYSQNIITPKLQITIPVNGQVFTTASGTTGVQVMGTGTPNSIASIFVNGTLFQMQKITTFPFLDGQVILGPGAYTMQIVGYYPTGKVNYDSVTISFSVVAI